ncbi:spinster family MFS transporter [Sphingomonas panacis]|nr:MFS transporter [Sphingomonas panacis]
MNNMTPAATVPAPAGDSATDRPDSPYAWYALAVLILVYMFNAMDRSILSILAEDIKRTFHMPDSQLGFLHGTAFGVFYALFGYPMGRLIDRWRRTKLLAIGLALWSVMTVVCGLSSSVTQLVVSRMGVGIGEATASPAGFSLTSDWFTKKRRATALGLFIGGLYLGAGIALAIGGAIALRWELAFPQQRPFGLLGWQAAFLAVGLPGILLAVWVWTLREPRRGLSDDVVRPGETRIWSKFANDVASVIPPLTLVQAARCGMRALAYNLVAAATAGGTAWFLIQLTGDVMQWAVIGFGYYAAFSSAQSMYHRDRPTFALTWGTPTFVLAMVGFGAVSMVNIVVSFWVAPLSLRSFAIDKGTTGLILGATTAICGVAGVISGGRLSDMMLRFSQAGRLWVGIGSSLLPAPFIIVMCNTHDPWVFYGCNIPVAFLGNCWLAAGAATIQELVLPRMRGTATTTYFLASTMIGSGLGPYLVGKISAIQGSLAVGIMSGLVAVPIAATCLFLCARGVERAETTKWQRASAAGEPD